MAVLVVADVAAIPHCPGLDEGAGRVVPELALILRFPLPAHRPAVRRFCYASVRVVRRWLLQLASHPADGGLASRAAPLCPAAPPAVFQHIARSASLSAWFAFCSTRKMVIPFWRSCSMVSKICWMTMGASPSDGSSSSSRRGLLIRRGRWPASAARRRTWCPPAAPAARAGGEQGEYLIQRAALLRLVDEEGPHQQVLLHRQAGEDAAPSGTTAMSFCA